MQSDTGDASLPTPPAPRMPLFAIEPQLSRNTVLRLLCAGAWMGGWVFCPCSRLDERKMVHEKIVSRDS
jgi:hypothetical protein